MQKSDASPSRALLPDDAARRAIREDLGTTILVEAAAGTGKTQSLVDRMVGLVAKGSTTVDRLAAVTFTIRAAAQLRQRFQNALETAVRDEREPERRRRLALALSNLDSCFLGTIHALGARLLRERPVEAGADPGFEEMDEPADGVARAEAWERHAQSLFLLGDPNLARLMELGVPLEDLRQAYDTLCENSDVEPAIGRARPEPGFAAARGAIAAFLEQAAASLPAETPPGGWTEFQQAVRRARRLWDLLEVERAPDFARILKALRPASLAKDAGPWKKRFEQLRQSVVKPALAEWEEFLHPTVMTLLAGARKEYDAWRRSNARLNFQDLLLYARNLLRDHPTVRRALRERFTPILVDEFQDTDPIQAEIVFYLTGEDTREKDWKKLVPVPGSLFVVGDPKQSIYRFRRADIETYEIVRARIARCGRVLQLSTNFRSTAGVCDWVNRAFGRPEFFPAVPVPEQAAWVALSTERPGSGSPGVFRLEVKTASRAHEPAAAEDARRVADAISAEVGRGARQPGDFLILFRRRKFMPLYAAALESRAIPCEIAGGGAFGASEELATLMPLLKALADPDNPVPLVAALRSPLFGVDDEALYRFARAGGRFHFRSRVPEEADPRIRRAYQLLDEGADSTEALPPAAAIARLVERLGATALAAARELGDSRAGNLLKALAAARRFSGEGKDFAAVVGELEGMRGQELIEQMSVEPGRSGAVRLMTLHGAKGLEAPIVFLADPTGDPGRPRDYWIDRSVEPPAGHFRVVRKTDDRVVVDIARPLDWKPKEEVEKRFNEAERVRLLYVGATRAKEMLVVSIWRNAGGGASGPWAALDSHLPANLPAQTRGSGLEPAAPLRSLPEQLEAFRSRRGNRRQRCAVPSYAVAPVTALAHAAAGAPPAREATGRGMEWGRIIHRLLEALMKDPALDARAYAENLFAQEERSPEDLEEAVRLVEGVRGSPLWRRALAAPRRLVEVPFALPVRSSELGLTQGPAETLLQGAIDLVFEEEAGWTLVDYKSDRVADNLAALTDWYAPQVRHYRRYWERLTGRPTRAGLFFVETGEEVWLEEASIPMSSRDAGGGEGSPPERAGDSPSLRSSE